MDASTIDDAFDSGDVLDANLPADGSLADDTNADDAPFDAASDAGIDAAADDITTLPVDASAAGLAPSGHFDLGNTSQTVFRERRLTAGGERMDFLQSFAFDGNEIYAASLAPPSDTSTRITRLDRVGNILSSMRLDGFGHAAVIGVERFNSRIYIWIESGQGTRVSRVAYVAGRTFASGTSPVEDRTPDIVANHAPRPTIDQLTNRLVIRYNAGTGRFGFVGYEIADARSGDFSRPAYSVTIANPTRGTLQSSAVYGSYAYFLEGSAYGIAGTEAGATNTCDRTSTTPGNACLSVVDLRSGRVIERARTTAFSDLSYREPEGIVVGDFGGGPHLVFGFVSPVAFPHTASLAMKSMWVGP